MNSAAVIGPRERIEERSRGRRDILDWGLGIGDRGFGDQGFRPESLIPDP
jgi:hypothetical protein